MWAFVIGMAVLSVLWIAGFLYLHKRAGSALAQAGSWPSIIGRVKQSRLLETYGRFAPMIVYEYGVDGHDYRGSRVRFGHYTNLSRQDAEAIICRYPEGGTVDVRYDPAAPSRAVLELSPAGRTFQLAAWVVGAPMLFLAILFGVLASLAGG